ncbi:hypothetical protein AZE42_11847 [Rhizopogon vesiculosus]|uniref:Uncharacterized protein n=1 Tax=Rhizopogon vesiculosus TaxID=180088 RepID=A0A1J8PMC0_9AGAM|nr:hypothetical protein AZE42_11847 [Rhizopogon vesiculosus]
MIRFYIVLKTDLFFLRAPNNAKVCETFDYVQSDLGSVHRILGKTSDDQYEYYKLKDPVLFTKDHAKSDIVKDCLDKNNWEEVSSLNSLKSLGPALSNIHVHLVIQPWADPAQAAIEDLKANYADIFSRLQIVVSNLQQWTLADIYNNLEGGHLWRHSDPHGSDFPVAITRIEKLLAELRTFTVPQAQGSTDYQHACHYNTHFNDMFEQTQNQSGDVTGREFANSSMSFGALTKTPSSLRATHPPPSRLAPSLCILYYQLSFPLSPHFLNSSRRYLGAFPYSSALNISPTLGVNFN